METSASFEARYAPLLYPTNQVPRKCDLINSSNAVSGLQWQIPLGSRVRVSD